MVLNVCCSIRTWVVLAIALTLSVTVVQAAMVVPPAAQQQVLSSQSNMGANSGLSSKSSHSPSQIKSYSEWKQSKIAEAEGKVKDLKETLLRSKGLSLSATEAGLSTSLQGMLDKEEMQFSLAQDLTISDYFVGYLTKQKSLSQAIKDVSGRLSPQEVAELMTAYADNFFNSKPPTAVQIPRADSGF